MFLRIVRFPSFHTWLFIPIILSLTACELTIIFRPASEDEQTGYVEVFTGTLTPSFTPSSTGTEIPILPLPGTPAPSLTLSPTGFSTQTLPTAPPSPTTSPSSTPTPAEVYAIVSGHGGILLGAVHRGQWLDNDAASVRLQGGAHYEIYENSFFWGKSTGSQPFQITSGACSGEWAINLTPAPPTIGNFLALGGNWPFFPRIPQELTAKIEVYQQVISDLLLEQGIENPIVQLTQLLRIDLEGDGADEVIISATFLEGNTPQTGNYSLVVARKAISTGVQNILLKGEFYPFAQPDHIPHRFIVSNFADLNGDGKLELIVDGIQSNTGQTWVFESEPTAITEVLHLPCRTFP